MNKLIRAVLLLLMLTASGRLLAQEQAISGTVRGSDGSGIPGVNVVIKGTSRGTTTGGDGTYKLNVPPNASLTFSGIGYQGMTVTVGTRTAVDVSMLDDVSSLDEVVVVGYGTQKKATLTGSVAAVSGKELVQSPQPNVSNSLVGRTPGLIANTRSGEPGADGAFLLIRGRSTTGDASPLIVVDGVANRAGGLDRLNPSDIESISILKDASASIYGAQAANGVILVTTKRGKIGKPSISYSFNQGFQSATRVPQMADAATYATLLNEMRYYQNPASPQYAYTDAEIAKFRDGSDPLNYPNTNWMTALLKPYALQHQHSLSLSGGSDKISYFVSAQNLFQDGLYRNGATNYKQNQIRSNIDAQVTKGFKISLDLAARSEDRQRSVEDANTIFRFALRAAPYLPAYYPNGLPGPAIEQGRNPVVIATDIPGLRNDNKNVFNGTLRARQDLSFITPGLFVDGFMAYDRTFQPIRTVTKRWTIYSYNKTTNTYDPNYGGPAASTLSLANIDQSILTYNAKINYDRTFGQHGIGGFLAYEQSQLDRTGFEAGRQNFIAANPGTLSQGGDGPNDLNITDGVNGVTNSGTFQSARQNYFGRVNYSFASKYLLEAQFRYDGSFNFAPDKRWGFFPSISAGWRISEEDWFKNNVPLVNNLKLRGSYGLLGNDRMRANNTDIQYQFLTTYGFDAGYTLGDPVGLVKGIRPDGVPNPNATWEVLKSTNVALEGSVFNRHLDFVVDVFWQQRSNILAKRNASVPSYTGVQLPFENIGKVNNNGVEVQLTYNNALKSGIKYSVGGNFTYVRNKVVYIDEVPGLADYQRSEGHPIGSAALYQSGGIFKSLEEINAYPHVSGVVPGDIKLLDVNGDKVIDEKDQVRIDKTNVPRIIYGINLATSYRNFDLSMLWQGQAQSVQYVLLESGSTGNFFASDVADRWSLQNPNGNWPRVADKMYTSLSGNAYPNTFWLRNTDFIRLKNVEIGYNLPSVLVNKVKLGGVRFYANGFNMLTITSAASQNIDPEGDQQTATFYPQQRTLNLGVNVRF